MFIHSPLVKAFAGFTQPPALLRRDSSNLMDLAEYCKRNLTVLSEEDIRQRSNQQRKAAIETHIS